MIVPYYIMASYAYYELDSPFISDSLYDMMAKMFLEYYHLIEHRHKNMVTKDMLVAGSFFCDSYPEIVKDAVKSFM